jgi:hypothetical protein
MEYHSDDGDRLRADEVASLRLAIVSIAMKGRHGARSTIVTSQLPFETWHDYVADLQRSRRAP